MKTVTHRDLRNKSGEVLRAVAAGQAYEITNRGAVVAHLVPPEQSPRPGLRQLTVARVVRFSDLPRHEAGESSATVLAELRAER